jgi:integrase
MAKKRLYGEGSITKRKDGRYQVSVPGIDGKRRYDYADTPKDAEKLRRQMLLEVEQGKLPASKQPFQVHVREWLEMKRKGGRGYKPNSYINFVIRMDAHFIPELGHIPLNKLSASHIQKLVTKFLDDGLHPNTIREYCGTLSACLDAAVRQGKIAVNPCHRVELPRAVKPKNGFLTQEEALTLDACKKHKLFCVLVPLALATEARVSELLALTWDDIDLERGTLSITKTITKEMHIDEGGKRIYSIQTTLPKTESGERDILLPDFAVKALRSHKTSQTKKMLASGKRNPLNLVFPGAKGAYWPSSVSHMFKRFAGKLGFDIAFHDLRHTGATLLLESGVAANVVQQRLGHANIRVTLGIYGHVTRKMKDQSALTLETLFTDPKRDDFEAM